MQLLELPKKINMLMINHQFLMLQLIMISLNYLIILSKKIIREMTFHYSDLIIRMKLKD